MQHPHPSWLNFMPGVASGIIQSLSSSQTVVGKESVFCTDQPEVQTGPMQRLHQVPSPRIENRWMIEGNPMRIQWVRNNSVGNSGWDRGSSVSIANGTDDSTISLSKNNLANGLWLVLSLAIAIFLSQSFVSVNKSEFNVK